MINKEQEKIGQLTFEFVKARAGSCLAKVSNLRLYGDGGSREEADEGGERGGEDGERECRSGITSWRLDKLINKSAKKEKGREVVQTYSRCDGGARTYASQCTRSSCCVPPNRDQI